MEWIAAAVGAEAFAFGTYLFAYNLLAVPFQIAALVFLGIAGVATATAVIYNATRHTSVFWRTAPFPLVVACYILFFGALYATTEQANPGTLSTQQTSWMDPWTMAVDSTVGSGMGIVLPATSLGKVWVIIAQYGTYLMTASIIPIAMAPSTIMPAWKK